MLGLPARIAAIAAGDLAGHERRAAARRLVVEQDAVARRRGRTPRGTGRSSSGRRPSRSRTGCADGTASSRSAASRRPCRTSRSSRPGRSGSASRRADRLEQPERAHARGVGGELGHLEADLDVALGAEVVDLVGLDAVQVADRATSESVRSRVVEEEPGARLVRVVVEVVDPAGREASSSGGSARGPRSPWRAAARPGTSRPGR